MFSRAAMSIILALVTGAIFSSALAAEKTPAELAKERLAVIREIHRLQMEAFRTGTAGFSIEHTYVWSRRWVEAARDASDKKADQVAALQAHLERMQQLEESAERLVKSGAAVKTDALAAKFYRLEAQHWLSQAKEK